MTEMAPVGYVGVSPKCILGFNKVNINCYNLYIIEKSSALVSENIPVGLMQNMGEEISLRLRTDDLKGFRKYESIKKTLLHELVCNFWLC